MAGLIFITVALMIPIYALLIWNWSYPEDSILFGERWMYREEPEITKKAIKDARFVAMTSMIGIPIVLLSLFLDIAILKLSLVLFPTVLIFGRIKIFAGESD
jgi:hypothetical protein